MENARGRRIKSFFISSGSFAAFSLLLLWFTCQPVSAQSAAAKITGLVVDSASGEYLAGANMLLFKDTLKSKLIKGAVSNKYGMFSIFDIPFGKYYLFTQFIGYKTRYLMIEVNQSTAENFFKILLPADNIQLKEIVALGYRDSKNTFNATSLPPELIKMLPSKSGEIDIYGGILALPGVKNASEMSNGLYIRGSSPDQTLTLIDGITLYNPFHLGGFASAFNSQAAKDIKLIKGSFPAEYGGRMSSVLDIMLKEGSQEKTSGNVTLGTVGSNVFIEGPMSDKATYVISGRVNYLKNVQDLVQKNSFVPRYKFYDMTGKFNFNINEKNKLTFSSYYSDDNLTSPPKADDIEYEVSWANRSFSFSWLKFSSSSRIMKFLVSYTNYKTLTKIEDLIPNSYRQDFYSRSDLKDVSIKFDAQFFATSEHTVKSGAEMTFHNFDLLNNDYYVDQIAKYESRNANMHGSESSVYLQEDWTISPEFALSAGCRFYAFPMARYYRFEPRLSFSYELAGSTFIKAAFANANQYLHFITRNDIMLPADIWFPSTTIVRPSNASQGSLTFETQLDEGTYYISAEGYYKLMTNIYEYSDTATFSIESPLEYQITSGKGKAYGMELFFNKRLGDLQGWIGYTLSWTERDFGYVNNGAMFHPRYDRRHDISIVAAYILDQQIDLGATWVLSTGQPYTMPTGQYYFKGIFSNSATRAENGLYVDYTGVNNYRLPVYHKLDVSASYKFSWHNVPLTATLSIYNVYNQKNAFARYVGFKTNPAGERVPVLKQFTLFPFMPALSITAKF